MLNVQCRLCSSETGLISLFNGKSRGNRDYIRKLVDITTGIKFEKNDVCKYICFSCSVQVYNFYIFRAWSVENDKKLQASTVENAKVKSNKIEIPRVGDIKLPSVTELREFLMPWLVSKQKYCTTEDNEDTNKTDGHNENVANNGGIEMVENSTQYESVQNFDKETQAQPSIHDVLTQTSEIMKSYAHIQCDLTKENQKECAIQTEGANANRSVHIQCQLIKRNQRVSKKHDKECGTQTEAANASQSVQIQCELIKRNYKVQKKACKEQEMQTEAADAGQSVQIQCELIKRNYKTPKKAGKERETQTEAANAGQSVQIQCELIKRNYKTPKKAGKERETQTEAADESQSVQIQCELIKRNYKAQKKAGKERETQTEAAPAASVLVQCDLTKSVHKMTRSRKETITKKGHTNELANIKETDNTDESVQCEIMKSDEKTHTREGKESATQTESSAKSSSDVLVQTDETLKKESKDCAAQTNLKCDNCLGQPLESHVGRCRELDLKDGFKLGLLGVKQELQSPRSLSPMKSLSINVDGAKTELIMSPTNSYASPKSSNLLTVRRETRNVIICQHCDKSLYSKAEYRLHKKIHMVCNFCKKKFTSIRKRKLHIESEDCEVKNLIKTEPVVPLVRLEDSKELKKKYASNLKSLSELRVNKCSEGKDVKRMLRLRSRSVSSIYASSTSSICHISILKGLSVGVNKSVQTNFLFDNNFVKTPLDYFCEKLLLKRNFKGDADDFVPSKKLKLS